MEVAEAVRPTATGVEPVRPESVAGYAAVATVVCRSSGPSWWVMIRARAIS